MTPAESRRRAYAYGNIDGLGEMGGGFFCAAIALLEWVHSHLSAASFWNSGWMPMVYFYAVAGIVHYGTKALKSRFTYPCTGFVEYRKTDRWRSALAAGVTAPLFGVGLVLAGRWHRSLSTPVSWIGLLIAASYAIGIARTGAQSWKWGVAWAMALGSIAIATLPADVLTAVSNDTGLTRAVPPAALGAYLLDFALYGVLLGISGGITFIGYVRHTPYPREQA